MKGCSNQLSMAADLHSSACHPAGMVFSGSLSNSEKLDFNTAPCLHTEGSEVVSLHGAELGCDCSCSLAQEELFKNLFSRGNMAFHSC